MTSNRYGVIGANVTEESQQMWLEFRHSAKHRGMNYTRALEQAARLWLDRHPAPRQDNPNPPQVNPFS